MKKKIVFLHLPKTGGTSLHRVINNSLPQNSLFPERFNKLYLYSREEMNEYSFFSGHYDWQSVSLIPGEKKIITLLRNPKKRILSLYYFWKAHTKEHIEKHNLRGPRIAKKSDLLSFLRSEDNEVIQTIDNAMTRNLIGGILVNYRRGICDLPADSLVSHAVAHLENMEAFGILEEIDKSAQLITKKLGIDWDGNMPHEYNSKNYQNLSFIENVKKEEITPEIDIELNSLTKIDQKIYSRAVDIFYTNTQNFA